MNKSLIKQLRDIKSQIYKAEDNGDTATVEKLKEQEREIEYQILERVD